MYSIFCVQIDGKVFFADATCIVVFYFHIPSASDIRHNIFEPTRLLKHNRRIFTIKQKVWQELRVGKEHDLLEA